MMKLNKYWKLEMISTALIGLVVFIGLAWLFSTPAKKPKFRDLCDELCKSVESKLAYCSEDRRVVVCE